MINVCNIFKPLSSTSGNFLLFSTYTDDIATSTTNSAYRVRPSRFFCMNFGSEVGSAVKRQIPDDASWETGNQLIPMFFQNNFENSLSLSRVQNEKYQDFVASADFWYYMAGMTDADDDGFYLDKTIVYNGTIDSQSWENGNGFADIIITIPSGASKQNFSTEYAEYQETTAFQESLGATQYPNTDSYISGWTSTDNIPLDGRVYQTTWASTAEGDALIGSPTNSSVFDKLFKYEDDEEAESFTFNSIIICYDVIDGNGTAIYKDIPMGIYFPGECLYDDGETEFTNSVTIYKGEEEALNVGSSWSLRICTRFAPTPHGYIKVEDTAINSGMSNSISALLAANAELLKTINETSAKSWTDSQAYNDLYAMFKNSRTNVPYVKSVNGVDYWFVNGRNTEMPVYKN